MFERDMEQELENEAKAYPIVTVTGPRQSGKTTLVRKVFPNKSYVNLEKPDVRLLANEDPIGFLNNYPEGVILDEIQRAPILLSYLQVIVDEKKIMGMYILTGSHQIELHQAISQSLAGRTSLLFLLPLSISELKNSEIECTLDEFLINGFYPRIYQDKLDPVKAYRNYLQTYIEKDVRDLVNVRDLSQFQKFLKLCAGRVGQLLNMEGLANDVGVAANTIKHWLSVLEASYIIILLNPYFENFGKRVIKSPKIYFTDVGLASYLLEIEQVSQMARDPLRGHLFENLILLELMKKRLNQGLDPHVYFYRDAQGNEVDFILKRGDQLIPIEVKSASTFNTSFLRGITHFQKLTEERATSGYLIYAGEQEQEIHGTRLRNFKSLSAME